MLMTHGPNSPGPLTDNWKVKDDSSVNFHDVFFSIFCQIIAKNEEKHIMEIYGCVVRNFPVVRKWSRWIRPKANIGLYEMQESFPKPASILSELVLYFKGIFLTTVGQISVWLPVNGQGGMSIPPLRPCVSLVIHPRVFSKSLVGN